MIFPLDSLIRFCLDVVCPHCVGGRLDEGKAQDVFVQAEVHFPFVRTCTKHEFALVSLPYDGHHFGAYDHCQRILQGRSIIFEESENVDRYRAPSDLQRYVLDRLKQRSTNFWFDRWELNVVAKTAEMLGGVIVFGSKMEAKSLSDADWHEAGQVGFDAMRTNKLELFNVLKELKRKEGSRLRRSLRYLGMLYSWLFTSAKHPQYEPVKDVFREYAVKRHPFGKGDLIFGKPCKERQVHTLTTTCAETGLHAATMTRILSLTGHLGMDQSAREVGQVSFPARKVQGLLDQINASVAQTKAQKFLNISRPMFNALKAEGVFRPIKLFEEARVTFDKADLQDFWEQISRHATLVTSSSEGIHTIARAANVAVCPASVVCKMLMTDELTTIERVRDEKGVGSLRICINELRSRLLSTEDNWIFRRELADILGIDDWGLKALLELGYFQRTRMRNPQTRKVADAVSRVEVENFSHQFISLKCLALEQSVSVQKMAHDLRLLEIKPISLRHGVRTQIFRRCELSALPSC